MTAIDATWVRRCRPLLGTFVEIALPPADVAAMEAGFAAVAGVHRAMSFHEAGSDLARLRRAPVGTSVAVDPETASVLRTAIALNRRTGGLFDVCVGRHLVADGLLPAADGVDHRSASGTSEHIVFEDDRRVACLRPMLIDLGGIAKGHAVDRAVEAMTAAGVRTALVNAGGDLRVLGGEAVTVHVRSRGGLGFAVEISDGALATSGGDDPGDDAPRAHRGRGGVPLRSSAPVIVAAPTCIVADAMTKVAMAEPGLAREMLAGMGGMIIETARSAVPPSSGGRHP